MLIPHGRRSGSVSGQNETIPIQQRRGETMRDAFDANETPSRTSHVVVVAISLASCEE
jgi:hypothetical protein